MAFSLFLEPGTRDIKLALTHSNHDEIICVLSLKDYHVEANGYGYRQ
jgi:hypothetical protein